MQKYISEKVLNVTGVLIVLGIAVSVVALVATAISKFFAR